MNTLYTTIIEFDLADHSSKKLLFEEFTLDPHNENKIYWIHCDLNQKDNLLMKLSEKLQLPYDVLKVCNQEDFIAKIMDDGERLTIQTHCLLRNKFNKNQEVDFSNLIIHLTAKYCFTASFETLPALLAFSENYQKAIKFAKTPCFILFLILDNVIEDYSKILFDLEVKADQIDLQIRTANEKIYSNVVAVKKQILKIKRYATATRDILMQCSGRKIAVVSDQCRSSLYNLYNHAETIVNETDSIREILNSTLDQADNTLMQKLNRTMQILTSFAAIFLPLSLIAGIYGMNFHWIPELSWKYGYFGALLLMLLCGVFLFFFFKKMKWV